MGYAVYHTEKGSGSGGGLGNHIDRVKGKEHTFKNADPNRLHLNVEYMRQYKDLSLSEAVKQRIEEGYNAKRKIRTDSVKYLTHVLTGSHKEMNEIFKDIDKAKAWISKNYEFACEEFGKDNIVRFSLHLDEKTPHIHAVTVPLTEDGRLSAKEIIGNKKVLEQRQDRYAKMMKEFGLNRGISAKHSQRKHETAQEYRKRVKNTQNNLFKADLKPVKTLGVVRSGKTIEKLSEQLQSAEKVVNESIASAEQSKKLYDTVYETANERRILAERKFERANEAQRKAMLKIAEKEKELKSTKENLKITTNVLSKIDKKYNIDVQKEIDNAIDQKKGRGFSR